MLKIIIIVWPSVLSTVTGYWQDPRFDQSAQKKNPSELNKIRKTGNVIYETYLFHSFAFILLVL